MAIGVCPTVVTIEGARLAARTWDEARILAVVLDPGPERRVWFQWEAVHDVLHGELNDRGRRVSGVPTLQQPPEYAGQQPVPPASFDVPESHLVPWATPEWPQRIALALAAGAGPSDGQTWGVAAVGSTPTSVRFKVIDTTGGCVLELLIFPYPPRLDATAVPARGSARTRVSKQGQSRCGEPAARHRALPAGALRCRLSAGCADLAELCGVPTGALVQTVKRNIVRVPTDPRSTRARRRRHAPPPRLGRSAPLVGAGRAYSAVGYARPCQRVR